MMKVEICNLQMVMNINIFDINKCQSNAQGQIIKLKCKNKRNNGGQEVDKQNIE